MEPIVNIDRRRPLLPRNLNDPVVRSLPEALEEITRGLMVEFINPCTSPRCRLEIARRLAMVKSVAGEGNYSAIAGRIRASLLAA